jgi:hypothetical protein
MMTRKEKTIPTSSPTHHPLVIRWNLAKNATRFILAIGAIKIWLATP